MRGALFFEDVDITFIKIEPLCGGEKPRRGLLLDRKIRGYFSVSLKTHVIGSCVRVYWFQYGAGPPLHTSLTYILTAVRDRRKGRQTKVEWTTK